MNEKIITKEEFDEIYVGDNVAVNCPTEELAKEFLAIADAFGYRWYDDDSYLDINEYDKFVENTCYSLNEGRFQSVIFSINNGYKLVQYKGDEEVKFINITVNNNTMPLAHENIKIIIEGLETLDSSLKSFDRLSDGDKIMSNDLWYSPFFSANYNEKVKVFTFSDSEGDDVETSLIIKYIDTMKFCTHTIKINNKSYMLSQYQFNQFINRFSHMLKKTFEELVDNGTIKPLDCIKCSNCGDMYEGWVALINGEYTLVLDEDCIEEHEVSSIILVPDMIIESVYRAKDIDTWLDYDYNESDDYELVYANILSFNSN